MNRLPPDPELKQTVQMLIAALAFLLAIAGQYLFYITPPEQSLWAGAVVSLMALLLFLGSRLPASPWILSMGSRLSLSYTRVLVGLAMALALMATLVVVTWNLLNRTNYVPTLILWGGSALAYVLAFTKSATVNWRSWLRQHQSELIGVGVITLLAFGLRFYQLGNIPRVIDGDEGRVGQIALTTDRNPLANPFTLVENFGGLYLQAIGLAVRTFGQTPFGLRLMPALGGTLAIPAIYGLGRYLFGSRVAWVAAFLLAISHTHIHFSRVVAVAYIQETWLVPLELYFFLSGLEKRSTLRLAIGGLILGVHFSVYVSAQIITALLLVFWLIAWWVNRPVIRKVGRTLGVFWLGVGLTALPQVVYAIQNPGEFFSRLNADGTFQSGWMTNTMTATGQNAVQILAGRVLHVLLSLNHFPAFDFYGARIPVLDVMTATLAILGLGYALWRTRDIHYLLLNGYFWALIVAIGIFSIPPSADSYRVLVALPAVMLFAAIGFDQLLEALRFNEAGRTLARSTVMIFTLLAILSLNFRAYYIDFAQRCRYGGDIPTRFASYLGNYLRSLDHETTVYLLSDEVLLYGTHTSVDFLSQNFPVVNVPEPIAGLSLAPRTIFVAVPARIGELEAWAAEHPGGSLHRESDCESPMLLAYQLP